MPKPFVYIQQSREDDEDHWYYVREADSLSELEDFPCYSGIDDASKNAWEGTRINSSEKDLDHCVTGGSLGVVAYRLTRIALVNEMVAFNGAFSGAVKRKRKFIRKPSKTKKLRILKSLKPHDEK